MAIASVLKEIMCERKKQDRKWGVQHHPDGTSDDWFTRQMRDAVQRSCQDKDAKGMVTWHNILEEEYFEVMAEVEWPKLRKELIQVAAVCVAWIEDGDQRS